MREPQRIRLRIPLKLPLKNELTPSYNRGAFFRYMEVKREWGRAIPQAAEHQRALGARRLRIVRLMTPRERPYDTANIWYSCASILDHLVHKGYLVNDTPDLLELEKPVQRLAVPEDGIEAPATFIEIEDLPGPAVRSAMLPLE